MARKPPPGAPSLTRPPGQREMSPRILVVCEGASEARCLEAFRQAWRVSGRAFQVVREAGDPSAVVATARERQRDDLKRCKNDPGADVEVWVAFDRDQHERWGAALREAQRLGFRLAVSNPCFELWGILLHEDQSAHIERDKAQHRLKQLHPGYDHSRSPYLNAGIVLARFGDAHRRASQLLPRAADTGDPFGNPTTRFQEIVERLRATYEKGEKGEKDAGRPATAPVRPASGRREPVRRGVPG